MYTVPRKILELPLLHVSGTPSTSTSGIGLIDIPDSPEQPPKPAARAPQPGLKRARSKQPGQLVNPDEDRVWEKPRYMLGTSMLIRLVFKS